MSQSHSPSFLPNLSISVAHSLFTEAPETKILFGFPLDIDPSSKILLEGRRFKMHAKYMIEMLDSALQLLGPDIELLTEILLELGAKHKRYGVNSHMFAVMGQALLQMLEQILSPQDFTAATKAAWEEVYEEISWCMKRGQTKDGIWFCKNISYRTPSQDHGTKT